MPKMKRGSGYKPGKEQVSVNGGPWTDKSIATKPSASLLGTGMAGRAAKQLTPNGYEEEAVIKDTGPGPVQGQPVRRKKRN